MTRSRVKLVARLAIACSALLLFSACTSTDGSPSTPKVAASNGSSPKVAQKVLAEKAIKARTGGTISAEGVKLVVPPGAMTKNGTATITSLGASAYDITLDVPWNGNVKVTIPLINKNDVVMHEVSGVWIPEGNTPGQATVTVGHLSGFSPLSALKSAGAKALCLVQHPLAFLQCLLEKGVTTVTKEVVQDLLGKDLNECQAKLLSQVAGGKPGPVAVSTLVAIFSQECTGKLDPGTLKPSPTSSPKLTSNGGSIQGGAPTLQGGTSMPKSTTPPKTSTPATVPAGHGRVLIEPCLNLRSSASGSSSLTGCIPKGTIIAISCTAQGNSVTGPYGATALWDRTTYNGVTGFVSDAWVYTGVSGPVAGACATPTPPPPSSATGKILISPCLDLHDGVGHTAPTIGCIPQNTVITIQCTAQGNSVTGPYGATTLWDRTTYAGLRGYVTDAYVYTGTASAVAPPC